MISPMEAAKNPAAETANDSPETKKPKDYQAVIAKIKERTGVTCEPQKIQIVIEAIANMTGKPDPKLVMKVLCQIAKQSGFNIVSYHAKAILAGQAKRAWEQINEAQPAEVEESVVQAKGETTMQTSDAPRPPTTSFRDMGIKFQNSNEAQPAEVAKPDVQAKGKTSGVPDSPVASFRSIDAESAKDPEGGPKPQSGKIIA